MNKSMTLLDRTFDEGVALTLETRNYIAFHEQADRREFELSRCLHVGYQHTRVSARLIQVMTWLLAMKALFTLELDANATEITIKARYKELVKRHHPDANGGDRSSEDKLREIIQAYNYLRANKLV